MKRGLISGIAMNGAALTHTISESPSPATPRDVEAGSAKGNSAWPRKRDKYLNEIAKVSHRIRIGYGEAAGQFLTNGIIEVKAC